MVKLSKLAVAAALVLGLLTGASAPAGAYEPGDCVDWSGGGAWMVICDNDVEGPGVWWGP